MLLIKVSVKERQEHSILTRSDSQDNTRPAGSTENLYKIIIVNGCVTWTDSEARRGRIELPRSAGAEAREE